MHRIKLYAAGAAVSALGLLGIGGVAQPAQAVCTYPTASGVIAACANADPTVSGDVDSAESVSVWVLPANYPNDPLLTECVDRVTVGIVYVWYNPALIHQCY